MFSIEWLADRNDSEPVDRTTYNGFLQRAAFIHAYANFDEGKAAAPDRERF